MSTGVFKDQFTSNVCSFRSEYFELLDTLPLMTYKGLTAFSSNNKEQKSSSSKFNQKLTKLTGYAGNFIDKIGAEMEKGHTSKTMTISK